MKKYGKSLVNAVPDEATKLLKVLCTDYRPLRPPHEREYTVQSVTSLFLYMKSPDASVFDSLSLREDHRL